MAPINAAIADLGAPLLGSDEPARGCDLTTSPGVEARAGSVVGVERHSTDSCAELCIPVKDATLKL